MWWVVNSNKRKQNRNGKKSGILQEGKERHKSWKGRQGGKKRKR